MLQESRKKCHCSGRRVRTNDIIAVLEPTFMFSFPKSCKNAVFSLEPLFEKSKPANMQECHTFRPIFEIKRAKCCILAEISPNSPMRGIKNCKIAGFCLLSMEALARQVKAHHYSPTQSKRTRRHDGSSPILIALSGAIVRSPRYSSSARQRMEASPTVRRRRRHAPYPRYRRQSPAAAGAASAAGPPAPGGTP